jgi:Xaa-Pro aminopeptidase
MIILSKTAKKEHMKKKLLQIFHNKIENILFTNIKETFYLTGANFDGFWLLFVKCKIHILCSKMIEGQIRDFFVNQNIQIHIDTPFYQTVIKILKQNKINRILIDPKYMNAADFILINEKLNQEKISIIRKINILNSLRIIKNEDEIINIKKSCSIVSNICNIIKSELKPGLCELDIHYRVLELFAKNRVTESFTPIIASGINSANPHHKSSFRKITKNDIIMMDIGCTYKGYCSDLTRTYFLDRIGKSDGRKIIWDTVKRSQDCILKKIRAGLRLSWADETARNIVKEAGYGDRFIHSTGHGIGIEVHEMPSLTLDVEGVFLPCMVVTIEPGIYIEQLFGVRIEDTILIKENGCEILTLAAY